MHISLSSSPAFLACKGSSAELRLLSAVPGALQIKGTAHVMVPKTPANVQELLRLVPKTSIDSTALHEIATIENRRLDFQAPKGRDYPPTPTGRTLMKHQAVALAALEASDFSALIADDMGLGKSFLALYAYLHAKGTGRCGEQLTILCPAFLKRNWLREVEMTIENPNVAIVHGTPQQRANVLARPWEILILNYDVLPFLSDEQIERLRKRDGMAIFDESHYIKNRKAQRTKIAAKLRTECNLLLSGTPIRNDASDLFSQLTLIEPALWRSYYEFEGRYLQLGEMRVGNKKVKRVVGTKNRDELRRVVSCYQIRRKKSEVLDLPPKITQIIELELDAETLKFYKAMRDWWIYNFADLSDDMPIFTPQARTALESALRLEQICQGFIGGVPESMNKQLAKLAADQVITPIAKNRPGEWAFLSSPKMDWLMEQIESMQQNERPLVVWFRFNAPLHYLQGKLGDRCVVLHGGLADKEKEQAIDRFQHESIPIFLGQVQMGTGFNLVRSQDQIFFGRDWSPAVNSQASDRLHRIGQKGTVNIYVPVIRNGIEWRIHQRLAAKENDAENVLSKISLGELRSMLLESDD